MMNNKQKSDCNDTGHRHVTKKSSQVYFFTNSEEADLNIYDYI